MNAYSAIWRYAVDNSPGSQLHEFNEPLLFTGCARGEHLLIPAQKASSSPALRKTLRGREYFTLAFGTMVGVGWTVVIDDWLTRGGAVGAMLGFLIGGLVLIPSGYVYGRLTERIPDAGSEIAYTGAVFPEVVSFGTGWMMTLAYLIVCPYEAVAIGRVGSYERLSISSRGIFCE